MNRTVWVETRENGVRTRVRAVPEQEFSMSDLFQGERVMAVIKRDKVPTAVMQAVQRAEMFLIPWTAGRDVYVNRPINPTTD